MEQVILAVDPGKDKCGVAVVSRHEGVKYQTITPTAELKDVLKKLLTEFPIQYVVLGNGTTSKNIYKIVKAETEKLSIDIVVIDEHSSTDEARVRYWVKNPPKGLKKLIPLGLQIPPRPVDDYVAIILAERYFKKSIEILPKKQE